ncbi:MAG: hypothetical protein OEX75_10215 [Gammaproteobacteria bacterium]|nr:hypothetical protein [Gammaproteobacteria bacterium]
MPAIEIADYTDAFDIRCPDRKQAAIDFINAGEVGAQYPVYMQMIADCEQVKIKITQLWYKTVRRNTALLFAGAFFRPVEAVMNRQAAMLRIIDSDRKNVGSCAALKWADAVQLNLFRAWHESAYHVPVSGSMDAEPLKRIVV